MTKLTHFLLIRFAKVTKNLNLIGHINILEISLGSLEVVLGGKKLERGKFEKKLFCKCHQRIVQVIILWIGGFVTVALRSDNIKNVIYVTVFELVNNWDNFFIEILIILTYM